MNVKKKPTPITRFLKTLGPGLVTGAADDDPSGIATYSQAGATYANGMLWTVPLTLPLMIAVQEICDRMSLATGDSFGRLIRRRFDGRLRVVVGVLLAALIGANCLNLAADLMAIGQGMQLLHAGPAPLWTAIAGVIILILSLVGTFALISKIFKWLCLVLFVYVGVLFVAQVDWGSVAVGFAGMQFQFTPAYLGLAVGILGTTISPYMFFWQSAERVEEMRAEKAGGTKAEPLKDRSRSGAHRRLRNGRVDVFTGMFVSVLIMFAIIVSTGATLGVQGAHVATAADAAKALEPIAGSFATILFAIGFVGSGMLAVPVLAAAGAAGMAGLLNKDWGLDRSPKRAPVFYGLLVVGLLGGLVLGELDSDPIQLLILSAIINGIAAGPFLIVLMLISRDRKIMGKYRNGRLATTLGWLATGVMCIAGAGGVWFIVGG